MGWVVNATPRPLCPRERPGTRCIGGWIYPWPVWTGAENFAPTGIRSLDRPARSESLYRLSYPSPHYIYIYIYANTHTHNHTHTRRSSWNPNANTLEPDRPQHGRPAACGVAHCAFQSCYYTFTFYFSIFFETACLKLRDLKWRTSLYSAEW